MPGFIDFLRPFFQDYLHSSLGCVSSSVHELAGDYEPKSAADFADEGEPDLSANILFLAYIFYYRRNE